MIETLQVLRGPNDKLGNPNKPYSHTIEGFFGWGSSGRGTAKFRGADEGNKAVIVTAQLYVSRDADLKPRDRVKRSNGEIYDIVGHSLWDADFPLDDTYDENLDEDKVFEIRGAS